jgi:hypothetical protein
MFGRVNEGEFVEMNLQCIIEMAATSWYGSLILYGVSVAKGHGNLLVEPMPRGRVILSRR